MDVFFFEIFFRLYYCFAFMFRNGSKHKTLILIYMKKQGTGETFSVGGEEDKAKDIQLLYTVLILRQFN